jgi:hypothetical protein
VPVPSRSLRFPHSASSISPNRNIGLHATGRESRAPFVPSHSNIACVWSSSPPWSHGARRRAFSRRDLGLFVSISILTAVVPHDSSYHVRATASVKGLSRIAVPGCARAAPLASRTARTFHRAERTGAACVLPAAPRPGWRPTPPPPVTTICSGPASRTRTPPAPARPHPVLDVDGAALVVGAVLTHDVQPPASAAGARHPAAATTRQRDPRHLRCRNKPGG